MPCVNCKKIRSAILHGKMAEAIGIGVDALREKIGYKADEPAPVVAVAADPEPAPKVKKAD